jgi:hypothetical protein
MTVLTVLYAIAVVYVNTSPRCDGDSSGSDGKEPMEYGIWKSYFAEKLATAPHEWNTTEDLGIIFADKMKSAKTDTYHVLIVDEAKALPWMRNEELTPAAVQYEDAFYRLVALWVTPGLPDHVRQWQIPIGVALGVGWIFSIGIAVVDYVRAKQEE